MNTLEKFLRKFYQISSKNGQVCEWPPTVKVEFINLELIRTDETKLLEETKILQVTKLSKRGEVSAIVKDCSKIEIKDIANYTGPRKVISIEGAPGIGKSTLAFKLCQDWTNHELLEEFSLVLYLPLRVPLVRIVDKVDDLQKYFGENCTLKDIERIKQTMGSGVLFVLDGWDELRLSCRLRDSFFPKLVRGEILPECSIIVTSRPGAIDPNLKRYCAQADRLTNIEVVGFTEEQVEKYICSYFKENEDAAQKLIQDLKAYPNVASTCYIAINLTIVCYVYWASKLKLPSTLTEVYRQFVLHTVKRYFSKLNDDDDCEAAVEEFESVQTLSGFGDPVTKTLHSLGQLALEGLNKGELSFKQKELTRACHVDKSEGFDGFGLMKVVFVYHTYGIERAFDFLHLTIQEYLAAYTVFHMETDKQRAWLSENLIKNTYEMVLKFFCGMDQFKSRSARLIFSNQRTIGIPFIAECIFEGQWKEVCPKIAKETSSTLKITRMNYIQPYRALVYGFVMTNSGTQWQLRWYKCNLGEHELKSMSRYLLASPRTIEVIFLTQCSFRTKQAVEIMSEIIRSQVDLSEVTFSRTQFDDCCFSGICKALTHSTHEKLQVITLAENELTDTNSEAISSFFTLPSILTVDLRGNNFTENGCMSILRLAVASSTLQELHLPYRSEKTMQNVEKLNANRLDQGFNKLMVHFP